MGIEQNMSKKRKKFMKESRRETAERCTDSERLRERVCMSVCLGIGGGEGRKRSAVLLVNGSSGKHQ